ncbi:MAG: HAD family hydrolase [Muribaculaceae bacterium]|nr:HAD family hydrolase [Muribaculaceae bacterium]
MAFSGLTEREAEASKQKYGRNVRSYNQILGRSLIMGFSSLTAKLFVISALLCAIAFMLGLLEAIPKTDPLIIAVPAAAAVLSALVNALVRHSSNNALYRAARSPENGVYAVFRGVDKTVDLRAEDLTVGDLVYISSEDVIPADGIMEDGTVTVDQSVFGVIGRMRKGTAPEGYRDNGMLSPDNPYCVYSGSVVCSGSGIIRITAVGDGTQLAKRLEDKPIRIPEQSFADLSNSAGIAGGVLAAIVTVIFLAVGASAGNALGGFLKGLSLGAAALAVSCIGGKSLACEAFAAKAVRRLARAGVSVSKPETLENAAKTAVLLTGKTGVFTKGEYSVSGFIDGDGKEYAKFADIGGSLGKLLKTAVLSIFSAQLLPDGSVRGRNPFDNAMLTFVKDGMKRRDVLKKRSEAADNGLQGATVSLGGELVTIIRGESEKLLERCTEYHGADGKRHKITNRKALQKLADAISLSGKDVEAIAFTNKGIKGGRLPDGGGFTLIGLIALQDSYYEESAKCVERLSKAGIRTVLVTGSSRENAVFTAKYAGIKKSGGVILTSKQLKNMGDKELADKFGDVRAVACAVERDKMRLVKAARNTGVKICFAGAIMRDIKVLTEADTAFAASSAASSVRSVCAAAAERCGIKCLADFILYSRKFALDYRSWLIFRIILTIAAAALLTAAGMMF